MDGRKSIVCDSIKFGLRSSFKHACLFMMIPFVGVVASILVLSPVFLYLQFFQNVGKAIFALHSSFIYLVLFLYAIMLGLFVIGLYLGFNKIALELCDRGKSSVKELFSCFKLAPKCFAAAILYSIAVAGGLILFIVPGIFIAIRCSLFPYCIIDRNAGVIESLNMSYKITENHAWDWLLLCIAVSIIMSIIKLLIRLLGPIGLIGYMFIFPFSALVYAHFYRSLVPQQNNRLSDAA